MTFRHRVCICLFWTKALIAFLLGSGTLCLFAYQVTFLHNQAVFTQNAASLAWQSYQNAPVQPPTPWKDPYAPANSPVNITYNADGTVSSSCYAGLSGYSRLEPPTSHRMMLGFSIDWSYDLPSRVKSRINNNIPAVINTFMEFDATLSDPYDTTLLNWFGSEVGKIGGMLEVTMAPVSNISEISDAAIEVLAKQTRDINTRYGVPILLRWGHEMNGDWTWYGYKPIQYAASFRRVAAAVRKYTNMTAMVWAPNVGIAYPFTPGANLSAPPTSGPEFKVLDTDGNGVLATNDDPYGPYYPGDEWVDWVGLSLYYYPFYAQNEPVPATFFEDSMNGKGDTVDMTVSPAAQNATFAAVHNFYARFAAAKNKPMMLPETGAPFLTGIGLTANAGEVNIKAAWWSQVFSESTLKDYPLLKLAVNFEESKLFNGVQQDWAVTNKTEVAAAFTNYIKSMSSKLIFGNQLTFACDGSIKVSL